MTLFQNKLEAINTELKLDKVGVTIQNRRNGLYLRAMLPDKYDPDWTKLKQQRISIRLTAEDTNLIKAKKLALKLSPENTKDISDEEVRLDVNNIYNLDRLSSANTTEGGVSITYGSDFTFFDKN